MCRLIPECLEDEDEIDDEKATGRDGEATQCLAGRAAVLRVVVRVQRDDTHPDEQCTTHYTQQGLLKDRQRENRNLIKRIPYSGIYVLSSSAKWVRVGNLIKDFLDRIMAKKASFAPFLQKNEKKINRRAGLSKWNWLCLFNVEFSPLLLSAEWALSNLHKNFFFSQLATKSTRPFTYVRTHLPSQSKVGVVVKMCSQLEQQEEKLKKTGLGRGRTHK